jgi:hypothetical protein
MRSYKDTLGEIEAARRDIDRAIDMIGKIGLNRTLRTLGLEAELSKLRQATNALNALDGKIVDMIRRAQRLNAAEKRSSARRARIRRPR